VPQDEQVDTDRSAAAAKRMVPRLLRGLDEREMVIVREHLSREKADQVSLSEFGRRLGVSRERMRQVRNELVARLRTKAAKLGGRQLLAA
jgi:DNA-directed RNA polymerase sigma subunit (sigma70/sigma32)